MTAQHSLAAFIMASLIGSTFATAQSARHEPATGSMVTLTSCVEKAQSDDTYVLTHVADVPVYPAADGRKVVYWLDKDTSDKLERHVGHQIRVIGKIAGVETREIDTKTRDGMMVEIEGPGENVKTTPGKAGVSGVGRDIKTTLVKLKVDKIEMVSERCQLTR